MTFSSPDRQHGDAQSLMRGTVDHPINVLKAFRIGAHGVVIDQCKIAIAVRDIERIEKSSDGDGLDHRESLAWVTIYLTK